MIEQNHYVLAVHDLERSGRFFESLGFAVSMKPEGWIFLERDRCMIMLGHCPNALPPAAVGDHSYFGYLRVSDVDGYYNELLERGVRVARAPETKPWHMREFAVTSPEGHRLTIGQWIGEPR
jgi:catechol 2,3-dioxygenase-like lactoylglutathione lyase family enzyme